MKSKGLVASLLCSCILSNTVSAIDSDLVNLALEYVPERVIVYCSVNRRGVLVGDGFSFTGPQDRLILVSRVEDHLIAGGIRFDFPKDDFISNDFILRIMVVFYCNFLASRIFPRLSPEKFCSGSVIFAKICEKIKKNICFIDNS